MHLQGNPFVLPGIVTQSNTSVYFHNRQISTQRAAEQHWILVPLREKRVHNEQKSVKKHNDLLSTDFKCFLLVVSISRWMT